MYIAHKSSHEQSNQEQVRLIVAQFTELYAYSVRAKLRRWIDVNRKRKSWLSRQAGRLSNYLNLASPPC